MTTSLTHRSAERGNVLFLILIAVALFAALSYAVTQSTRSGSGNTDRETNALNSAVLTQYPTAVRTAVVRMLLGGKSIDTIGFDATSTMTSTTGVNGVFYPTGGGAVMSPVPEAVMNSGSEGTWYHNGNFEVPGIGTSGAGGNELIAFVPGITLGICLKVNDEFGIPTSGGGGTYSSGVPVVAATDANITDSEDLGETFPTTDQEDIDNGGTALDGNHTGCFYDSSMGQYIFYSVIIER